VVSQLTGHRDAVLRVAVALSATTADRSADRTGSGG
jgi:hypothetical protein